MAPEWRGSRPRSHRTPPTPCALSQFRTAAGRRGRAASSPRRASTTWSSARPSSRRWTPARTLRSGGRTPRSAACRSTPKWTKWYSVRWGPRRCTARRKATTSTRALRALRTGARMRAWSCCAARRRHRSWTTCVSSGPFPSTRRRSTAGPRSCGTTRRCPSRTVVMRVTRPVRMETGSSRRLPTARKGGPNSRWGDGPTHAFNVKWAKCNFPPFNLRMNLSEMPISLFFFFFWLQISNMCQNIGQVIYTLWRHKGQPQPSKVMIKAVSTNAKLSFWRVANLPNKD